MTSPGTPEVCPKCHGVVIITITQANGKRMPVDRDPADDGTYELVPAAYGPPVSVHRGKAENGERRYRAHFPTCRRRQGQAPRSARRRR